MHRLYENTKLCIKDLSILRVYYPGVHGVVLEPIPIPRDNCNTERKNKKISNVCSVFFSFSLSLLKIILSLPI